MVKDKAIFKEIITEVMKAKTALNLPKGDRIIYPPNMTIYDKNS